jgi:arylsulfatase A-like enzyme
MTRLLSLPAVFAAALFAQPLFAAGPPKPNVVILLVDDQGYGDLSSHGNPALKTPNIDKLGAQSVRFTDFHVAPMCSPTRGQLMSGMDCLHNGASSVSAGRSFLRRGIPTMAEIFAGSGYKTALFGKWHLGDSYPNLPNDKGFHEAVYHLGWGITSMADTWQNDYFDPRFRHNGKLEQYNGYCTDIFFDLTTKWIKQRKAAGEPFFVYLPTNAPHGPLWCPEKYKKMYEGVGTPALASFFGMIANIDDNVGKFDAFLKGEGLFDNTIFIYMNDNGGTAGVKYFNAGMRAGKTTYYDGGHRAICFVRWPNGGFRKPCAIDALTEVQDILPTLVDLCALKKPDTAAFDGTSLAPLLTGKADALADRILVVQYAEQPGGQKLEKGRCSVMWNKWRLVHDAELFDLKSDPGQMTDIAAKNPDIVQKLQKHYEGWWRQVEKRINDFEPVSIGADQENPVTLSSADWNRVYCDNMGDLRSGRAANGPWSLLVEKDGDFEIELRRWPKEADAAISAGVPAFKAFVGGLPEGKALPIAKIRLKIAGLDETKPVGPNDKGITFNVALKAGTRLPMQTWCLDGDGKELCGAYFAYVRRK